MAQLSLELVSAYLETNKTRCRGVVVTSAHLRLRKYLLCGGVRGLSVPVFWVLRETSYITMGCRRFILKK